MRVSPLAQAKSPLHFNYSDQDISNLTALSLHLEVIGRRLWAEETADLACRIAACLATRGHATPGQFSFSDFGRLMGRTGYAAEVSDTLRLEVRSIARRIWCGLTGESVCPIIGVAEGGR